MEIKPYSLGRLCERGLMGTESYGVCGAMWAPTVIDVFEPGQNNQDYRPLCCEFRDAKHIGVRGFFSNLNPKSKKKQWLVNKRGRHLATVAAFSVVPVVSLDQGSVEQLPGVLSILFLLNTQG